MGLQLQLPYPPDRGRPLSPQLPSTKGFHRTVVLTGDSAVVDLDFPARPVTGAVLMFR